ncbi:hypothetical protein VWM73_12165, partial [Campylobacter coli]
LEFEKSRQFSVHYEGKVFSLENAFLYEDGSILLGDKRVYSLRFSFLAEFNIAIF